MTAQTVRLIWTPFEWFGGTDASDARTEPRRLRPSEARTASSRTAGSWQALHPLAKLYVGAIVTFGAVAIVLAIPQLTEEGSALFTSLAILSLITSFAKVNVPVRGGASTLTVCYVVDFTTLLLLGAPYATLTTAMGVWTQCTFKCLQESPIYQTWFSIGTLALTVQTAGLVYNGLDGQLGFPRALTHVAALAGAATAYFLMNSMLIAGAVAVSSGQSMLRVWWANYAKMWRGHLLGFSIGAMAAAGITHSTLSLIPLAFTILALTYGNFKTYAEGFSESTIDALTDLPNRRSLESRVTQEIARADRERSPLSVMVVDLNRFKSINDTYGHAAGDAALRHVAQQLQRSLRAYDICARYGGDEFVVVLPGCGSDDAAQKAAVLRQKIRDAACEVRAGLTVPLQISVGTAVFPRDGRTFEELFAAGDRRMYEDKAALAR